MFCRLSDPLPVAVPALCIASQEALSTPWVRFSSKKLPHGVELATHRYHSFVEGDSLPYCHPQLERCVDRVRDRLNLPRLELDSVRMTVVAKMQESYDLFESLSRHVSPKCAFRNRALYIHRPMLRQLLTVRAKGSGTQ